MFRNQHKPFEFHNLFPHHEPHKGGVTLNNNELLIAISDMIDQKLDTKIIPKIKGLEENLIPRIANLEENLIPRVANLEENLIPRVINIELRIENDLIPRISHMEDCYISTYERYQKGIDQLDEMQRDIDVIKATVTGHSNELNKFADLYFIK